MFIFPLGLSSRLPRIPLMCLLLLVANVAYSINQFPIVDRYEKRIGEQFRMERSKTALIFLFDLCMTRFEDAKVCQKFMPEAIEAVAKEWKREPKAKEQVEELKLAVNDHVKDFESGRVPQSQKTEIKSISGLIKQINGMASIGEEFRKILDAPKEVHDPALLKIPSYASLLDLDSRIENEKAAAAKELGLLNFRTKNAINVLKAGFTHGDWAHLIGNMLVFLLLGAFLEARIGAFGLFAVFIVSSFLGLLGHVLIDKSQTDILLGASAGVSGVIGAFLALFWNRPIKVWLSYLLVFNRVIYAPTYLVIGAVFIVQDFTGALTTADNVAHDAHLIGLAVGLLVGYLMKLADPLHEEFLYPGEQDLAAEMKDSTDLGHRKKLSRRLLSWNPNNLFVLRTAFQCELQSQPFNKVEAAKHLTSFMAISLRQNKEKNALAALQMVPVDTAMSEMIPRLGLKNHLRMADTALKAGDWLTAIRLYDVILGRFQKAQLQEKIRKSMQDLSRHLRTSGVSLAILKTVFFSTDIGSLIPFEEDADGRRKSS